MSFVPNGVASVSPGKIAPLNLKDFDLKITNYQDGDGMVVVHILYPDGSEHVCQADKGIDDVIGKITQDLKGTFAAQSFEFSKVPSELKIGETFTIKDATYGA